MQYSFQVENIRCGGCSNTITTKLLEIDGVIEVHVHVDDKQVVVTTESAIQDDKIKQALSVKLEKLGYPETGSIGADRFKNKAVSVVSCAIGKISSKN
ncbi:MAG: heavy-metal-associated domain-containing protein [Gammaproteobacteria bacterium]